ALEMKKDADEKMIMAYLFKHTPLQINFAVNLTCLIPTENPEVGRPERLDLKQILWHFLHFRLEVVTKRLEHELAALKKRIHILEGFEAVFDALDEIIKMIRKSDGKSDAAEKIMARFELDADQTDAILELKIYRLARRLGEAAERSEGPHDEPAAGGRFGAGRLRRQHACQLRLLHQFRRRLHLPDHRRPGVDRLRRTNPKAVQTERRREGRRGDE